MSTGTGELRHVEPFGLFFLSTHWYLAARDIERGELRNFRLSRIQDPVVNTTRSQTADYEIPRSFDLREHARSRQAWELGDGTALQAVVEFRNETGAVAAAERLGTQVEGFPSRRSFEVRRIDAFSRWLLSFGGEAVPVEPPALQKMYRDMVEATLRVYAKPDGGTSPGPGAGKQAAT